MSGPVVAFDINATRGGTLKRVDGNEAAPSENDPSQQAYEDRFSPKARARADIAATYAGLLGVDLVKSDLLEKIASGSQL